MKFDYDLICIGLGPAGMAVSIMGSSMGLNVCAIEKNKIGGECMNVGCIPSKSLLRMAKARHVFAKLPEMEMSSVPPPDVMNPFTRIASYLSFINEKKNSKMFDRVDLHLGEGAARFVDDHTVAVNGNQFTAKHIFIATGTRPMVPPIPGIDTVDILTNENMFNLERVPASMVIIGGGAIGTEMAQAFSRLGCKCSIVQMDPYLVPAGSREAGELLEEVFQKEGIEVYNGRRLTKIENSGDGVRVHTDRDEVLQGERLLMAAGRRIDLSSLDLEKAGVAVTESGAVQVDNYLRTSKRHIFAVGDCNGHYLLSHSAMHQGMIALMNCMMPVKMNFKKFVVPWTVFTEPQLSQVGVCGAELDEADKSYMIVEMPYEDYGATVAENVSTGFIKIYCSKAGRIYGVCIVGEGSGDMINEWALAIQKKIRLHDIMMLQHSFPTMGYISKMASERWMMSLMGSSQRLRNLCRFMFRRRIF